MNTVLQVFKQLYIYTSVSMPLIDAVHQTKNKCKYKRMRQTLEHIEGDLRQGQSIQSSLGRLYTEGFIDSVSWSLITIIDRSGDMSALFKSIYEYLHEKQKNRYTMISSLMYPIGMIFLSGFMMIFLVMFVFPKITPLFKSMNAKLPPLTQFMVYASNMLWQYMFFIITTFGVLVATCTYAVHQNYKVKRLLHVLILNVPVYSRLIRYRALYSVSYISSVLLSNNKNINETLRVVVETVQYIPIREYIQKSIIDIENGKSISMAFSESAYVDDDWLQCVQIGEKTGKLSLMFSDISKIYKEKYLDMSQLVSKVSEPVALCVTATMVLLIALSVIQPMYGVLQVIQN